jgi:hypothetical protein
VSFLTFELNKSPFEKMAGRIERYRLRENNQAFKRDLCHHGCCREPINQSFLTGIQAPKSERFHFPMRPADEITELAGTQSSFRVCGHRLPEKAFYENSGGG